MVVVVVVVLVQEICANEFVRSIRALHAEVGRRANQIRHNLAHIVEEDAGGALEFHDSHHHNSLVVPSCHQSWHLQRFWHKLHDFDVPQPQPRHPAARTNGD